MSRYAGAHPTSPAPTTTSSLNYSQYASTSFGGGGGGAGGSSRSNPSPAIPSYHSAGGGGGRNGPVGSSANPSGAQSRGGQPRKDSKDIARTHWRALRDFLSEWSEKESPTARASAREKLTRLNKQQFQELSTDVYDELVRRQSAERGPEDSVPFLPVRDDFHPKRNQARQKLATLPKNRFKDLASDVFFELRRRFPEFQDEVESTPTPTPSTLPAPITYDEPPPAPGPVPLYGSGTGSGSNVSRGLGSQRPSQTSLRDLVAQNATSPPGQRATSGASHHRTQSSVGSSSVERSRPSRETSEVLLDGASFTTATNDVVVPNKSRLLEEDIEVPYARDSIAGGFNAGVGGGRGLGEWDGRDSRTSTTSASIEAGQGLEALSPNTNDDRDYFDRISFSSNFTSRSKPGAAGATGADNEKLRAEYEFRIAGLERRLQLAESERDEARRIESETRERRQDFEEEIRGLKERATTHASSLRSVQHELDVAHDAAEAARQHNEQMSQQVQEEIAQWRERCEGLEDELHQLETERGTTNGASNGHGHDEQAVVELKAEVRSLVDELNALALVNDRLAAEREREAEVTEELEARVEEYRRKWEAARVELRNLKATSTMFVSKPFTDDHLPASPDGNIADINVSAFQSAIDGLLAAARSSHPSGVLSAMKAIVESVTHIGEDVKTFEARPNLDVDVSRLESLKYESTSRLSALMQAARNHAMASGLSPVSLIDAAAGHLSANVVEIIKLLKIRRSGKTRDIIHSRSSMSIRDMVRRSSTPVPVATPQAPPPQQQGAGSSAPAPASAPMSKTTSAVSTNEEERLRDPRDRDQRGRGASPYAPPYSHIPRDVTYAPSSSPSSPPGAGHIDLQKSNPHALAHPSSHGQSGNGSAAYDAPAPQFRIQSFQSASSTAQRSDSFDLERKGSTASAASGSERLAYNRPVVEPRTAPVPAPAAPFAPTSRSVLSDSRSGFSGEARGSMASGTSSPSTPGPVTASFGNGYEKYPANEASDNHGADDHEWNDLKPYLNTQSSALVNSIQNLLAAIRTGGQGPALNEHLSEVIAISSSIVAVSTSALPLALRREGDPLLADLVANTDKLGEAQTAADRGGGFDKSLRQGIASASFGVAKALKALMKLGGTE